MKTEKLLGFVDVSCLFLLGAFLGSICIFRGCTFPGGKNIYTWEKNKEKEYTLGLQTPGDKVFESQKPTQNTM